jgi:hypothetical protein
MTVRRPESATNPRHRKTRKYILQRGMRNLVRLRSVAARRFSSTDRFTNARMSSDSMIHNRCHRGEHRFLSINAIKRQTQLGALGHGRSAILVNTDCCISFPGGQRPSFGFCLLFSVTRRCHRVSSNNIRKAGPKNTSAGWPLRLGQC